ncbi:hypothetical protein AZE42_03744 [Rhizopogon vesiculosus]|uniref:Uncharacterized protein n=1 Tax=Rhizopogon vesiculosus TaxID=180088 RepID=A0A1J8R076_9AGAM|nr:hypothetical protein AZE42_03744 [Rhizopogon vesiculosus]
MTFKRSIGCGWNYRLHCFRHSGGGYGVDDDRGEHVVRILVDILLGLQFDISRSTFYSWDGASK